MNKKGNTLVEVIVSIVVVSILVGMLLTVFVQSKKVQTKLDYENRYITTIDNIFGVFSSDPSEFEGNLKDYLGYELDDSNKTIVEFSDGSKMEVLYVDNSPLYSVSITMKNNKGEIIEKYNNITRNIIDKEVTND